jgi:putative RNA 2'-phosphotransferase
MNPRQLSKFLSLVLRHQPRELGLTLDPDGFVPLSQLLAAMQAKQWKVTEADIREVVDTSDKQRFEIVEDNPVEARIRARYGHSVAEEITYPEVTPPEILYHGTSPESLIGIRRQGLRAMRRQYVHLSTEEEQAKSVGRRHHRTPVILVIRARAAADAGVAFYRPESRLYLARAIPPEFIELPE